MPVCSTCGTAYGSSVRICVRDGTPLVTARTDNKYVGTLLDGKYRIDAFVSSGGMGSVYRAVHVMLDKTVAVKVIKNELVTSDEIVARFQREARAASNLNHPNIVSVYDLGQTDDGTLYIAMEFIDGPSLKDVIRKNGPLTPREAIDILRQVASALSSAHRKQIVHRDLKSDNLMLVSDGGRKLVKLVDFGIAKTFDDSTQLTAAGFMLGTPHYMSPEQAAGKPVDHRADLYSLGVILYEMLTGLVPFGDAALTSMLVRLATEVPPPPSARRPDGHVPPALDAVAARCLEKDPERRYQSADEFADALERASDDIGGPPAIPAASMGAAGETLLRPTASRAVTNAATYAREVPNPPADVRQAANASAAARAVATPPPPSGQQAAASTPRPGLSASSLFLRIAAAVVVLGVGVAAVVYGLRLRNNSPQGTNPPAAIQQPQSSPAPQPTTPAPTSVQAPTAPGTNVTSTPVAAAPLPPIDDGRGRGGARNENATRPQAPVVAPPSSAGTAQRPAAASAQAPPPVAQTQPPAAPAPPPAAPAPAAPAPTPAPAQPVISALPPSVTCQGVADVCGVMRAEILRSLQESQVTGGDIELVVKVALVSERPSTQFGAPSTIRTYSVDVTANSRGTAIAMPTPRVFGFDALFGRTSLQDNARQIATGAVEAVRAFKAKN